MLGIGKKKKGDNRSAAIRRRRRMYFRSAAGRAVWSPGQRRGLVGAATLVGLVLLILGGHWLMDWYLLRSGRFVLRRIDVQAGDTITRDRVCEYLRIKEGMPLFEIDIVRRQKEFMRDAATIRSLTITRKLPDRMSICVIEREPLARMARHPFAVNSEGLIFVRYIGIDSLPCISGYPGERMVPGTRVGGSAVAALELLELLRDQHLPLQIVDIDVSHEDYLACTMSDQRRAKLAWKYQGDNDTRSRRHLLAQLKGLATAMNSERGQRLASWDATIQGRAYAR